MSSGKQLLTASKKGDVDTVIALLDEDISLIDYVDSDDDSVLNNAAWKGQLEVVKVLVERGAKLEHKNRRELNALHHAACKGNNNTVRYLVENGIDVNARTKKGTTSLMLAKRNGHLVTMEVLLEMGAIDIDSNKNAQKKRRGGEIGWGERLLMAAKRGDLNTVQRLVQSGAPLEFQDKDKDSVLNIAAWLGHTEVIEYLFSKGAKLESPNKDCLSALHHASYKGHIDAAIWLMKKGCNIEARSLQGNTPLIMAARNGLTQTCQTLIELRADPSARNNDNESACEAAKKMKKIETYTFLTNCLQECDSKSRNILKQIMPPQLLTPIGKLPQSIIVDNKQAEGPNPALMAARSAQRAIASESN